MGRVAEEHEQDMAAAHDLTTSPVDREGLIGLLATSLETSATLYRERTLMTLFSGALFALITGQCGAVDAATCGALARTMVAGIAA